MDQAAGPPDSPIATTTEESIEQSAEHITIEPLRNVEEVEMVSQVFQQIWGSPYPIVGKPLLRAIAHSGGYVVGAFEHDGGRRRMVGASVGFRGIHDGAPSLHSHITGLLAGVRSTGIGRVLKQHQREWCAENGIDWVTWTFDPLMRRNAWFNIEILGAQMAEYLTDFYGPIDDAVNGNDDSDRLLVAWSVNDAPAPSLDGEWTEAKVPTPENVVELRRTDPASAAEWRRRLRNDLGVRMQDGALVTGFDREGNYVLQVPS